MADFELQISGLRLSALLGVEPGLTAITGGGGKTTLMYTLAEELRLSGSVIVCTTTGILQPQHVPVLTSACEPDLTSELNRTGVVCVGVDAGDGKLRAPAIPIERLPEFARYVLVEADGSRGLPMKAHAVNEPVIPVAAAQTVLVIGASGFGRTIRDAAHRPELYAKLACTGEDAVITPELAARVTLAEGLHDRVFINQVESEYALQTASALACLLRCPVCAGSLHRREYYT